MQLKGSWAGCRIYSAVLSGHGNLRQNEFWRRESCLPLLWALCDALKLVEININTLATLSDVIFCARPVLPGAEVPYVD